MKKTMFLAILAFNLIGLIGCSSEDTTGSDYVPPADESPEEEGDISGSGEDGE